MDIKQTKQRIIEIENDLKNKGIIEFNRAMVNGRSQITYITSLLKKNCKKKRVWKSKEFLITLKNINYGIDNSNFRSKSGKDGIFILDRNYLPKNEMQRKIFDQFIDKENSDFKEILKELDLPENRLNAIRVVSHHMRLLGIHFAGKDSDIIVLVNYDNTK